MGLLSRLAGALWRRSRVSDDVADEIAFHIEERTRENIARGMTPAAAREDARQRFGNTAIVMDRTRDADVIGWLDALVRDAGQAFRSLRRRPGLVATTLLVLGLGIGATSAIFSVVDSVLLKPLAVADPGRVVALSERRNGEPLGGNPARLRDYRDRLHTVTAVAGWYGEAVTLTGRGEPERVLLLRSFGPILEALGSTPRLGRGFTGEEEAGNGAPVLIATHGTWQRRFGGDSSLVGQVLTLNGTAYTVVGILPEGADYPEGYAFLSPANAGFQNATRTGGNYFGMLGRLAGGATLAAARTEVQAVARDFAREFPATDAGLTATVESLQAVETAGAREPLLALLGAVALVLLIACVNTTSLLLARAAERRHEAAIRTALGAGRASLVRLYLLESGWLALGGGLLGLFLAWLGVPLLRQFLPGDLPRLAQAALDWRVALFAVAAAVACGLAAGLVPALLAAREGVSHAALRDGGRSTAGPRRLLARQILVGAQVAVSMMLLVGAALLGRSLIRMRGMPTGVTPERVLAVRLEYPWDIEARVLHARFAAALSELAALPGVRAVGFADRLPLEGQSQSRPIRLERPDAPGVEPIGDRSISQRAVDPGYFEVLGVPLLEGRVWRNPVGATAPREVVVNRTFARRFLPPGQAVGARFTFALTPRPGEVPAWYEVVGVAGDVRQEPRQQEQPPEFWMPYQAAYWPIGRILLRFEGDPAALTQAVRATLLRLDPGHVIDGITTLPAEFRLAAAESRVRAWLVSVFALAALLLSAIGLYGVLASDVAQRQQELGVRLALGADPDRLRWMVVRQGGMVALAGVGVGATAAAGLARLLANLLFGVRSTDLVAFVLAALALGLVSFVASWIPARRAARLDPVIALRRE